MARNSEHKFGKGEKVKVYLTVLENKDRDNQVCEVGGARFTASEKELAAALAE